MRAESLIEMNRMNGKNPTYVFATLLSLFLLGVFVLLRPEPTQAQFQLFPGENPAGDFRNYILNFYTFSIAAGTLIATVLIMIGGMIWVTSAGNPSRIELAKSYIIDSIIGVVLLMSAVVLLRLINPALVELPKITPATLVGPSGACVYQDKKADYQRCETAVEIVCKESLNNGTWKSGKTCDEVCPPEKNNPRPGECVEGGAAGRAEREKQDAVSRASYCAQFSTSGDVVNQRVSDSTRFDTWQNCQTYCTDVSRRASVPYICSGSYIESVAVGGRLIPGRCNCS